MFPNLKTSDHPSMKEWHYSWIQGYTCTWVRHVIWHLAPFYPPPTPPPPPPCNTRRLKIKVCILFTETANTRVPTLFWWTCMCIQVTSGTNGIFKTATHCIEQLTRGGFEKHGEKLSRVVVSLQWGFKDTCTRCHWWRARLVQVHVNVNYVRHVELSLKSVDLEMILKVKRHIGNSSASGWSRQNPRWYGSPHLLVTPAQFMRPGIGQHTSCVTLHSVYTWDVLTRWLFVQPWVPTHRHWLT